MNYQDREKQLMAWIEIYPSKHKFKITNTIYNIILNKPLFDLLLK